MSHNARSETQCKVRGASRTGIDWRIGAPAIQIVGWIWYFAALQMALSDELMRARWHSTGGKVNQLCKIHELIPFCSSRGVQVTSIFVFTPWLQPIRAESVCKRPHEFGFAVRKEIQASQ